MNTNKRIFFIIFLFLGFLLLGGERHIFSATCTKCASNQGSVSCPRDVSKTNRICVGRVCTKGTSSSAICFPNQDMNLYQCCSDSPNATYSECTISGGICKQTQYPICECEYNFCGECKNCTPSYCNNDNETEVENRCTPRIPYCIKYDSCGVCGRNERKCYPKGTCQDCDKTCPENYRLEETTCEPIPNWCTKRNNCTGVSCGTTPYSCYPIGTCAPSCDLVVPSGYHFPQPGEITLCPHGTARCDINTNCGVFCREETATVYEDEPSIKPSPPITPKLKIDGYTYTLSTDENNWTRVRKPLPGKPEDAVKFSVTPQTPPSGTYRNPLFDFTAVFLGLSQGAQPLFATAKGAGDEKMFQALLRFSQQVSWILSLGVVAVCMAFPKLLASIFISGDPEVLKMTLTGLRLYSLGFLFLGFNLVGTIALQSAAKSKQAFIFAVARGMMMLIAFMLGLKSIIGILGVWLTFFASELVGFIWMNIMLANERKTPSSITAELQSR